LLGINVKKCLGIKILDKKTKYLLMLASCYFPLFDIFLHHPGLLELCAANNFCPSILKIQIYNVIQEKKLKNEIISLSTIEDNISLAVREQYEKYPYPRWHSAEIALPEQHLYQHINQYTRVTPVNLENATMLIAGCGTGKHILNSYHPNFKITAIDLSLSSLAYAMRNCLEYGITNVKFYQADILNLENLNETFDIIESCGVLHHTRSIDESFGELYKKLKPKGFFLVALYSTTAREYLKNIRDIIKSRGYKSKLADIRHIRETVMAQLHNDFNRKILKLNDFFTSSMLIDLLFHCNEITVDIPFIKDLAKKYNMEFITFNISVQSNAFTKYRERFPNDLHLNSLDNWHQFEQENPDTFIGMYQFVLQKN
jgi:SAM-dependent methyltransferase